MPLKKKKKGIVFDRLASSMTASSQNKTKPLPEIEKEDFHNLVGLVKELKSESLRHLELETEAQTEFEVLNSQLRSNRSAVGKLAELMLEDIETMQSDWQSQFQEYQIECNQRLCGLESALERLEFRYGHHLRDYQSLADQVERNQDGLAKFKLNSNQHQLYLDQEFDKQNRLMEQVKFTSIQAEERASLAVDECSQQIDVFQQRYLAFGQDLHLQIQEITDSTRDRMKEYESQRNRQGQILHKTLDDVVELRGQVGCVEHLKIMLQRHQQRSLDIFEEKNKENLLFDQRLASFESILETQSSYHMNQIQAKLNSFAEALEILTNLIQTPVTQALPKEGHPPRYKHDSGHSEIHLSRNSDHMSSTRVRLQNQLLTKLGAAKPSSNVEFDMSFAKYQLVEKKILAFHQSLRGYFSSLQGMQCAAFNLDQSIERFQQLSSGDTSSEGRAESSVITASSPTEDTEKGLLVSAPSTPGPIPSYLSSQETSRAKLAQVFHSFESLLLKPTEVWINECQQMKCHVLEYTKVHHNYDHYTRKVLVLRGRGDKMDNNNNNNNKSKAMEKLVRNEQKLIQATTEYHEASSKIIHKLNEFISHQDQIILPLLQRFITFQLDIAQAFVEQNQPLETLLSSPCFSNTDTSAPDSMLSRVMQPLPVTSSTADAQHHASTLTSVTEIDLTKSSTSSRKSLKSSKFGIRRFSSGNKHQEVVPASRIPDEEDLPEVIRCSFEDFVTDTTLGEWENDLSRPSEEAVTTPLPPPPIYGQKEQVDFNPFEDVPDSVSPDLTSNERSLDAPIPLKHHPVTRDAAFANDDKATWDIPI